MQKHDIKTIEELNKDEDLKGQWRECDIDELYAEYFMETSVLDREELDYGFYNAQYFREKFPGLPDQAYEILASERHKIENFKCDEFENVTDEEDIKSTTLRGDQRLQGVTSEQNSRTGGLPLEPSALGRSINTL